MARTKASVGAKISAGKSSKVRCSVAPPPSSTNTGSTGERSSRQYSGGNPVCPRETPKWQKPITNFFISKDNPRNGSTEDAESDTETAGTSKPKRTNVIESDEEATADIEASPPTNRELDESLILEPLKGDDSHKIEEYYPNKTKGKGQGKKSKNKENINQNSRRNSVKRDLEEVTTDDESGHASKKVKVG
ncbi:hypothetical protein ACJJTC_003515 [Scirpophaga incertulas]